MDTVPVLKTHFNILVLLRSKLMFVQSIFFRIGFTVILMANINFSGLGDHIYK